MRVLLVIGTLGRLLGFVIVFSPARRGTSSAKSMLSKREHGVGVYEKTPPSQRSGRPGARDAAPFRTQRGASSILEGEPPKRQTRQRNQGHKEEEPSGLVLLLTFIAFNVPLLPQGIRRMVRAC